MARGPEDPPRGEGPRRGAQAGGTPRAGPQGARRLVQTPRGGHLEDEGREQERREAVCGGDGRDRAGNGVGTHRQAVRLQPEDEQVEQGHLADALDHPAAEAEPDLDQQEGLSKSKNPSQCYRNVKSCKKNEADAEEDKVKKGKSHYTLGKNDEL